MLPTDIVKARGVHNDIPHSIRRQQSYQPPRQLQPPQQPPQQLQQQPRQQSRKQPRQQPQRESHSLNWQ